MSVALVLSGGGSRGDFQVGAVRYLYDQGIRPDIICGTSVGAINGAKLAEGEGAADQGLKGLEQIWLDVLRNDSDLSLEEEWLFRVNPLVRETLAGETDSLPSIGPELGDLGTLLKLHVLPFLSLFAFIEAEKLIKELQNAQSVYNLLPIERMLRGDAGLGIARRLDPNLIRAWSEGGRKLRLATVSLDAGKLRYVTESGAVLERDNRTPALGVRQECVEQAREIDAKQAEMEALTKERQEASSQDKPRVVREIRRVSRELSELRRGWLECLRRPGDPVSTDIPGGVLASASIAGFFRPVRIGQEMYVDGGFCTNLPVEPAVDLAAGDIYAVTASWPGVLPSRAPHSLLHVLDHLPRALLDITVQENVIRDIRSARELPGVRVISPSFDFHDIKTIDPGLIRIAMAYGYMRAADVHRNVEAGSPAWSLCDDIIRLRLDMWRRECIFDGQPIATEPRTKKAPPERDQNQAGEILNRKEGLRRLLIRRYSEGGILPFVGAEWHLDANQWPLRPEGHPFESTLAVPIGTGLALPAQVLTEFRFDGGGWAQASPSALVRGGQPAPSCPGRPAACVSPDGVLRLAYADWNGHLQEVRLDGEGWALADLTALVRNPPAAPSSSGVTSVVTPDGVTRVLHVGWSGHLQETRLDAEGWAFANLSSLVRNRPLAPLAVGTPTAVVSGGGVLRIFYRGRDDGHVHEVRLDGEGWAHADLMTIVRNPHAATARGGPSALVGPDGVIRVFYSGRDDGHIHEIRLDGEGWAYADLSGLVRNPPASTASMDGPTAFLTPDGVVRIVYLGRDDGRIHEIRLDGEGWAYAPLSDTVGNNPPAPPGVGGPAVFVTPDRIPRVLYRRQADGGIQELRLEPGGWFQADLTGTIGNRPPDPPASSGPLTAIVTPDGVGRIIYVS